MEGMAKVFRIYDANRLQANGIFDLEDSFIRQLHVTEYHPRPIGAVRLYLMGRIVDTRREDFARPLQMLLKRSSSGYLLFFGLVQPARDPELGQLAPERFGRAPRANDLVQRRIAAGTYVVRVTSDYYQEVERSDIVLPRPAVTYFFDLAPGPAYPFPGRSR